MKTLKDIEVGRDVYEVQVDDAGKVVGTACRGRWPMCNVSTGSAWLDGELQRLASERLADEEVPSPWCSTQPDHERCDGEI